MRIVSFLARPQILFFTMPLLMVILTLGTLAQRYMGLHDAQALFFDSWILWIGPIPAPGMATLCALIAVSLMCKLITKSPWSIPKGGIILTHLGVVLLLAGGLMTSLSAEESFIMLREGETGSMVSDYHQRELAIVKDEQVIKQWPMDQLRSGMDIQDAVLPFSLHIETFCRNCTPLVREGNDPRYKDLAAKLNLVPADLQPQDEDNQAGIVVEVRGAGGDQDGIYLSHEVMPRKPAITHEGATYQIALRKVQRPLPFSITLKAFEKQIHPGTDVAREYQSDIVVTESSGVSWPAIIRMNEPLRTQGYTLYQSSVIETQGERFSVLAVVKNKGWLFPYIACAVMAVGLIWHSVIRLRQAKGGAA